MTPGKAQQIGNDLACLAASIAGIAEEIKAMYDFDHDSDEANDKPDLPKEEPAPEPPKPNTPSLEEVRGILADKASSGFREAVQAWSFTTGNGRTPTTLQILRAASC